MHVGDEVSPLEQLHAEEPALAVVSQLTEAYQVGVLNLGQGAKLALERVQTAGAQVQQRLDGDALLAVLVEGFVDDAEASGAKAASNFEAIGPYPSDLVVIRR